MRHQDFHAQLLILRRNPVVPANSAGATCNRGSPILGPPPATTVEPSSALRCMKQRPNAIFVAPKQSYERVVLPKPIDLPPVPFF